jgi:DNA polymerase-3 subunit delta'
MGEQLDAGRLPQAFMLTGAEGVGKLWFLRALASRLLCAGPVAGTACGSCKSCELLKAGSHSDFMALHPEEGSRQIRIEQVRKLIQFAGRTPALGSRKILLIGPAELMNSSAANALLKSLEEPSESTTLLLSCNNVSALPATIRSRCQITTHVPPSADTSVPWLQQFVGDADAAAQAHALFPGQPLLAAALADAELLGTWQKAFAGLTALIEGRLTALEYPELVKELPLDEVLLLMQRGLEEALRQHAGVTTLTAALHAAYRLRDDLGRKRRAVIAGGNPNRQLLVEDYSAKLGRAFRPATS